jgi:hypothetical protein
MAWQIRPARREQTPLLVGMVGPSGSGKTLSAIRMASGIREVVGGEVAVIDTEGRRSLHYAAKHKFNFIEFLPPFTSQRYVESILFAKEKGAKTIVVDSTSHEHEGQGGYLEYHESEIDRMAGADKNNWQTRDRLNFGAWKNPAAARRRLINTILQVDANFIFCFRAKDKLVLVKDRDGKNVPTPIGYQAIAGEEFVFEMTCRLLFQPGSKGVPDWTPESLKHGVPKIIDDLAGTFTKDRQVDEKMGAELGQWAMGGIAREGTEDRDLYTAGNRQAAKGMAALEAWFVSLTNAEKVSIKPRLDDLKSAATMIDEHGDSVPLIGAAATAEATAEQLKF